jgi:ribonuclease BN (tRNA processing enzyme)
VTTSRYSFQPGRRPAIELSNTGDLQVAFLGVGAAFATEAFQSNIFLIKGRTHLLVDLGTKASLALRDAGLSVLDIQNLLATHSHADHIGGIEEWCLKSRYLAPKLMGGAYGDYKPNLYTTEEYLRVLWKASLRGGLELCEDAHTMTLHDFVEVHLADPQDGYGRPVWKFTVGEGDDAIRIKLMRTRHIPSRSKGWDRQFWAVGLLVDDRVLISGDTTFDPELIEEFGADAEAIFHDCQDVIGGVHAAYEELLTLPDDMRSKMILYHLPRGITEKFDPQADGFAGWAKSFREGSYLFP